MKKLKKVLAMMLSLAMVLAMSLTAYADNGTPAATDKAEVSITGIEEGATVNLYQIAFGKYGENGAAGFIDYEWIIGTKFENVNSPTADEINEIAQKIENKSLRLTPLEGATQTIGANKKYSCMVSAGAYIAIITSGANDTSIYNPILLTASYVAEGDEAGNLEGHTIGATERYLGTAAVAKKTTPEVKKEIVGGTTPDTTAKDPKGNDRKTASVGDVITYQISPTMPSYPTNATNKTLTFTDTMTEGLTFVFDSLEMSFLEDSSKVIEAEKQTDGSIIFKCDEKEIAKAFETTNGFTMGFDYDTLLHGEYTVGDDVDSMMLVPAGVYTPVIRYNAVLNDKANVGGTPNPNHANMYYANKPNTGSTFKPTKEHPEPTEGELEGIEKKEDVENVYTYQLAFLKTGEGDDADKLAGAVFGIYKDLGCSELIDVVKANESGYAVSSKVEAGTYYIKELLAPSGYQLNNKIYSIVANKTSASQTITTEERSWKYTTEKPSEDAKQIGWIDVKDKNDNSKNVFYELGAYNGAAQDDDTDNMAINEMPKGTNLMPAYAVYDNTSVTTTTTIETKADGGTAATLIDTTLEEGDENYNPGSIPNTKLASLPSTGGIGTTIFTIGGCIIMIIAAGLFFASRRKKAEN